MNQQRILSLDVFRGITMVLMLLVNSQGTRLAYPLLEHAEWNGCTLADLVFPFFLFIVGITTVISLNKHKIVQGESKTEIYLGVFRRSAILFGLGLFLNIFPHAVNFETLRVYGILQRIALCYFICAISYLNCSIKTLFYLFVGLLIGYWLFMTQVPVPGFGADVLTPQGSWVAYFDQLLFSSKHLYGKTYDPEGLLSTCTAIATTLSGVLVGQLLLQPNSKQKTLYVLIAAGILCMVIGWLWSYSFPINKNLWTSSFVLWTSGIALLVFAFCYLVVDLMGYEKWSLFFKIFGLNAIFIFVFHVLLLKGQHLFSFKLNNNQVDLREYLAQSLFGGYGPQNAALFYSIGFILLNFIVAAFLYRRKIVFKI